MNWSTYQLNIFEAVSATSDSLVIEAVAGCVSGDTVIGINRGGKSYQGTIAYLFEMLNGGKRSGKVFDLAIPTQVRNANITENVVQLSPLAKVVYSGRKSTWKLRTATGHSIRATEDHLFYTQGGWNPLRALCCGESVWVDAGKGKNGEWEKPSYKYVYLMDAHPYRSVTHNRKRAYYRVPEHRLIMEALLNKVEYTVFLSDVQAGRIDDYQFLDPEVVHVHHEDEDTQNNSPNNLVMMTPTQHHQHHAKNGGWKRVQAHLAPSTVVEISPFGEEDTFDLTIADGYSPNFLANGIVVHNSGKTTTIVEAIRHVPSQQSVLFCAFNKVIADTLKGRVTLPNATCATLHSLGLRAWQGFCGGGVRVEGRKTWEIAKEMLTWEQRRDGQLVKLVGLAKQHGVVPGGAMRLKGRFLLVGLAQERLGGAGPHTRATDAGNVASAASNRGSIGLSDLPEGVEGCVARGLVEDSDETWIALCDTYDIDSNEVDLGLARQLLKESLIQGPEVVDYDDMLWLPIVCQAPFPQFDVVFCDEIQDVSSIQGEMIARMVKPETGRVIGVGDRKQSIYAFRGAGTDAMDKLSVRFQCRPLPLSISYRCPKAVVNKAKTWVDQIEPAPDAPEGLVVEEQREWTLGQFKPSDVVLCRLTRPLVALAFRLIRARIACRVLGRDIGQGLIKLIEKAKLADSASASALSRWLNSYEERETKALKAKEEWGKIGLLRDKCETLRIFIADAQRVADVRREIEGLFKDSGGAGMVLSTIHRFKGQEAMRVFVLDADLYQPVPWATDLDQERNLQYVACTRAMAELYYLSSSSLQDKNSPELT